MSSRGMHPKPSADGNRDGNRGMARMSVGSRASSVHKEKRSCRLARPGFEATKTGHSAEVGLWGG